MHRKFPDRKFKTMNGNKDDQHYKNIAQQKYTHVEKSARQRKRESSNN